MAEHLLSIIIPVYNGEKYLPRCIDSVLTQPGGVNWELILVNDGSKDKTAEICKRYSEKYENIHYILQENTGVYRARIHGIEEAKGDWITFMDHDDTLTDDAFSVISTVLDDSTEILVFDFNSVADKTVERRHLLKREGLYARDMFMRNLYRCGDDLFASTGVDDSAQFLGVVWAKVYQRWLFHTEELPDLQDVFLGEDGILFTEVLSRANQVRYMSRPVYNYFRNPNSESQSVMRKGYKAEKIIHNFESFREYSTRHINSKDPYYAQMIIQDRLQICKVCLWNRALSRSDANKIYAYCRGLMSGLPEKPVRTEIGAVNYLIYVCLKYRMKYVLWLLVWARKKVGDIKFIRRIAVSDA